MGFIFTQINNNVFLTKDDRTIMIADHFRDSDKKLANNLQTCFQQICISYSLNIVAIIS